MSKLDTADDVLQWAHSVCHPVKGTVKSGPNYDDVAAYIAECVRLRRAFEDFTAPWPYKEPSMYRATESQMKMIDWLRAEMKGGGDG
jgi:hypothetical protein